jgi:hypothetical protein
MSGDILVVTALVLLLPAIFLVVLLVAPLPLAGLARLAVFCALFLSVVMPFVVWIWSRPTAFAIRGSELEIIWPARRRSLPLRGLESVEIVHRRQFRDRYGRALRVGAGGLWGAFGSAITKSERFHLYVSRTDRFVLLRPAGIRPWVLTPAHAEQFVEAVKRAASEDYQDV